MRTEARLTHTGPEGDVGTSLAGSWAAGAVLVTQDGPARFDRVAVGRASIFTGGHTARLPDHGDGWRWEPHAVDGADIEAARQQLQRLMRDAESDVAEQLCSGGWLTVLDGPLHGIRHRRGLPVIGYVKTHHPRPVDTSQEPGLDSPNPELPPSARADQPSGFGNIDLDECPLPRARINRPASATSTWTSAPFRARADQPAVALFPSARERITPQPLNAPTSFRTRRSAASRITAKETNPTVHPLHSTTPMARPTTWFTPLDRAPFVTEQHSPAGPPANMRTLEISSRSDEPLGRALSAMNLRAAGSDGDRRLPVESVYQAAKCYCRKQK